MRNPVSEVQWVLPEKVKPNDYNPNRVAGPEMGLLKLSILRDGWTQPIVTNYDPERDVYVVVDGFHRYWLGKMDKDVQAVGDGKLPIVVLDQPPAELMAATVRHNRARGRHGIGGMSQLVYRLLEEGKSDPDICESLGLTATELVRLKHITGYAKLYAEAPYNEAYEYSTDIYLRHGKTVTSDVEIDEARTEARKARKEIAAAQG